MIKPKNIKISTKIRLYVISICAFALIGISTTAYIAVKKIIAYSLTSNTTMGDNAREDAERAILGHTRRFLQIIAREQGKNCEYVFGEIQRVVSLLEGAMRDILNHPEHYQQSRPIFRQQDLMSGTYGNTWLLPETAQMTPDVEHEIAMMSHLAMVTPSLLAHPDLIEVYAGLASGLLYAYSPRRAADPKYDPRSRPWYIKAQKFPKETIFTDAYEDAFGKGMVITASKALFDDAGNILGVVALDVNRRHVMQSILETQVTKSGHSFIVDSTGRYVLHSDMGKAGFKGNLLTDEDQTVFQHAYKRMMNREAGFAEGEINGEVYYLTFCPISVMDWSVGVIVSRDEVLASLKTFTSNIASLITESEKNAVKISDNAVFVFAGVSCMVAAMVIILAVGISYFLTKPITNLISEIEKIDESNLQHNIAIKSNDEIGMLTETFNRMTNRIYEYTLNILELNATKSQLETAANTDSLTRIFNRRYFMTLAALELERSMMSRSASFIVFFDIDHFKRVNDTYGHAAGDETLKSIAARVKDVVRPGDVFARYGGEEFIVFVSGVDTLVICTLAERIRLSIRDTPIIFEDLSFTVTASFGIAPAAPENDLHTAIRLADEALYRAKDAGRDNVVFWPSAAASALLDGGNAGADQL